MSESTNEWECSKGNIQPIQQGRKAEVLKVALALHPEDVILQQRQAFEQELRTYSGNDPLDVWYRYIKWVEQNFPKGGKEGHIEKLIQQCLSILKEEKNYFDDERFIEIWIKFANTSTQPIEVYDYMYSNSIGCKSSRFYISWAWELEQLGNFKKADEVLREAICRKTEPFEKLKASFFEFESRFVNKVKEGSEINENQGETVRSAFSVLKPQKKHSAPVMRTGDLVLESNKVLTLGGHQPQPKHNMPSKKPFRIFSSENVAPSLPVQSENVAPFILYSENIKENERKPGKWNKVKVKQQMSLARSGSEADKGFKFHCDDSPQSASKPRIIPKTSNILSVRQGADPPTALFEPPDPMKRPMYNKDKIYGGAKEFSFEEIRCAAWQEKKKKLDQEQRILEQDLKIAEQEKLIFEHKKKEQEMTKIIDSLTQQINILQTNKKFVELSSASRESNMCRITNNEITRKKNFNYEAHMSNNTILNNDENDKINTLRGKSLKDIKHSEDLAYIYSQETVANKQGLEGASYTNTVSENLHSTKNHSLTDDFQGKGISSASYREAANMVQDFYNGTLSDFTNEIPNYIENGIDSRKDSGMVLGSNKCASISPKFTSTSSNHHATVKPCVSKESKVNLPFALYHDPTEVIPTTNENFHFQTLPEKNNAAGIVLAKTFNIKSVYDENVCMGDVENMPPDGYIQEKSMRKLAGILEPSKNIPFIPLDQQELEDDADNEVYEGYVQHPLHNDTLVPPSNTEQFSAAISLPTSTPCINKIESKCHFPETEIVAPLPCTSKYEKTNKDPNPCLTEANNEANLAKVEVKTVVKDHNTLPGLPNGQLSIIMETSRECYSKSSSSSNSSTSLTKSSQFDQHSINRKHFSKHETFRDPSMLSLSKMNSSDAKCLKVLEEENIEDISSFHAEVDKPLETFCTSDDPFDQQLTDRLLKSLPSFQNYKNMFYSTKSVKTIKVGESIEIGNSFYIVERVIGEGSYAKIYEIQECSENYDADHLKQKFAFKVCRSANEWEVYICFELQKRLLGKKCPINIRNSVMSIMSVIKYADGIAMVNEYSSSGTLLDVVNFYKKQNSSVPEYMAMFMTSKILQIVSNIHDCNIIHGDIKPDNFLMMHMKICDFDESKDFSRMISLKLIDFGRAIDLNLFRPGVCFTEKLTSKFQCNEMKDNKPWVFQLDWYGVLNCIHTMLFSEYMTVKKNDNKWQLEKRFKRYWYLNLWEPLFNELLNIPSCYEKPNVKPFINMIESKLQQNVSRINSHISSLYSVLK